MWFRLDRTSGIPPYRQLMEQVELALQLGHLRPGDRLPSVREAVRQVRVNPNTVHRAYRELEHEGIVVGRPGDGTFVADRERRAPSAAEQQALVVELASWVGRARRAGLADAGIRGLVTEALEGQEDGGGEHEVSR